jgi:hypothetical protein
MVAWEISALMTAFNTLFACASPYGTSLSELKRFFGLATFTGYLFRLCSENRGQHFFKFLIIVAIRRTDRTNTAVHSTGRQIFLFHIHKILSKKDYSGEE